jgi:hypothetical protein
VGRQAQIMPMSDSSCVQRKALLVDTTPIMLCQWESRKGKMDRANMSSLSLRSLKRGLEQSFSSLMPRKRCRG